MRFKLSGYPQAIQRGISKKEKGEYARNVAGKPIQFDYTIQEFSDHVGAGKGFTLGLYENGAIRNASNVLGSHLLALDFDSKSLLEGSPDLTIDNVVNYLEGLEMSPNVVYKSTSYQEDNQKFRVIWFFKEFINPQELKAIMLLLTNKTFSKRSPFMSDKACKDPSRFYLGGFDSVVINPNPLRYEPFKEAMINEFAFQDSSVSEAGKEARKRRENEKFSNLLEIGHNNNNTIVTTKILQNEEKTISDDSFPKPKTYTNHPFNYELACERSPRFQDFHNGVGERLTYDEEVFLCLTLFKFKGGADYIREKLLLWNHNVVNKIGFHSEARIYDESRFRPLKCKHDITHEKHEYSSEPLTEWWDSEAPEGMTRLSELSRKTQEELIVKMKIPTISAGEGRHILDLAMKGTNKRDSFQFLFLAQDFYKDNTLEFDSPEVEELKSRVITLRGDMGLGKTEQYLKFQGSVIAVPTHSLKAQVALRFEEKGKEVYIMPEVPTFQDSILNERITQLRRKQSHKKISDLIAQIANRRFPKELSKSPYKQSDCRLANEYVNAKRKALNSSKDATIITTHKAAIFVGNGWKQDKIVFDENPVSSLFETKEFRRSDIMRLLGEQSEQIELFKKPKSKPLYNGLQALASTLANVVTYMNSPIDSREISIPQKGKFLDELSKMEIGEDIIAFLESDIWQCSQDNFTDDFIFKGVKRLELPKDKQITVLSATIEEWELDQLGYNQAFFNIPFIENKGSVIQDATHSMSRQALRSSKNLDYALEKTKDCDAVITYKGFKSIFDNADELTHLGNTSGYDHLKGKSIAIIGDHRPSPIQLVLQAKMFNFKLQKDWQDFHMINYENKYFKYSFYGSKDENINRLIKLQIDQEQSQAIGRARAMNENTAKVTLFSAHPSVYSDFYISKTGKITQIRESKSLGSA